MALVPDKYAKKNPESNLDTAYTSRYFGDFNSEEKAPIFATFGYRDPRFYIQIKIGNDDILALIDCGSTKTYLGKKAAKNLGHFENTDLGLRAANNNTIKVNGIKTLNFKIRNVEKRILTRYVDRLNYDCILGMDFLKTFGLRLDFGSGTCSLLGGVVEDKLPRGLACFRIGG